MQAAQSWAKEERQKLNLASAAAAQKESEARQLLESAAGSVDIKTQQLLELEISVQRSQQSLR